MKHIYTYIYFPIYTYYIYIHIHVYTYIYLQIHIYTDIYLYVYVYVYLYISTDNGTSASRAIACYVYVSLLQKSPQELGPYPTRDLLMKCRKITQRCCSLQYLLCKRSLDKYGFNSKRDLVMQTIPQDRSKVLLATYISFVKEPSTDKALPSANMALFRKET